MEEIKHILTSLGYTIDEHQPHTIGERFLMQAVTTASGRKTILIGTRQSDKKRVVIKITNTSDGMKELEVARKNRETLHNINFASRAFFSPKEILFTKKNGYLVYVQEFIEQESAYLERPLEEQFFFALNAFKAQEGAHATTHKHMRLVRKSFEIFHAKEYLQTFATFVSSTQDTEVAPILAQAQSKLEDNKERIEQYCGFLVHTDFVPHNFRIQDKKMYLLDHSSIRFGNKYEGWARFLNFMTLYNPELENLLVEYVRQNRAEEELESLTLMRIYRLGEIINYYIGTLPKSAGNLLELNKERVRFWSEVLRAQLSSVALDQNIRATYIEKRDMLRSPEEKLRQQKLH